MYTSLFQESVLVTGLVTQAQLDEARAAAACTRDGPPAPLVEVSDELLAAQLVAMGLVTAYQAEQLKAGRTKLTLGPYLITDWIAQGGMGQVFKAVHQMMGREVAIKVLPYGRTTPESIASFTREIRLQAQLDHHNLVRAFDAGHDGNVYFLVTEYVPGTDLRRLVRSQGRLSMQQAALVIAQAAHGLAHAHSRGLIHRDVKPGNVLVTPAGLAKISDLGLVSSLHPDQDDPRAGRIVGTADYISPEQIVTPRDVTPVSDIYSLGCTLYYAITGKVPYPGGSTKDKARRHREATPWHPRRFAPEVSEEFVDVIADMMAKDPAARIQSALEVAARLETWAIDAAPLDEQRLAPSPWMPPPLPGGGEDVGAGLSDTDDSSRGGSADLDSQAHVGSGQVNQGTTPIASSSQTTNGVGLSRRSPPPAPLAASGASPPNASPTNNVLIALAVAVPVSMALGALIALAVILSLNFGG